MYILSLTKSFQETAVSRHMSQQTQFNLGIVCRQQIIKPFPWLKKCTNCLALFCAHRYILQVWIRAGKPASCRHRLVEGAVNTSICFINQVNYAIQIRGLQLAPHAESQYQLHHWMLETQRLQHLSIGRITCLGLFHWRQSKFFKKHLAQLFRRINFEFSACQSINISLQVGNLIAYFLSFIQQMLAVHVNSPLFHISQHLHKRQLNLTVQLLLPTCFNFLAHERLKLFQQTCLPHSSFLLISKGLWHLLIR